MDVSIVVPVYNEDRYLKRCIDSILAQTKDSLEIIIVNDGSTDGTAEICNNYRKEYPEKIRVIHKANGGLTAAWKEGCRQVVGKYIGFVDADDYIEPDMYEVMYNRAVTDASDIVCCGIKHVYEEGTRKPWTEEMKFEEDVIDYELLRSKYFPKFINDGSFMGRTLLPGRVTKLVSRELVMKNLELCNDEVSVGEDMQFSLCVFADARRISNIKNFCPYIYYMNNASMTMSYDALYMNKIEIMRENLLRISRDKNYDFSRQIYDDFLCLTILAIKGSIIKRKGCGYAIIRKDLRDICNKDSVKYSLKNCSLNAITLQERVFIRLMKWQSFLLIYACIRIYFAAD